MHYHNNNLDSEEILSNRLLLNTREEFYKLLIKKQKELIEKNK